MSDQLPDDAVTAATENVTAFLLGCGWTVAEAAEVAPHLADNIVAAVTPAIAERAAADERERIVARLRRMDDLWGRRGWLANAADLIELHPELLADTPAADLIGEAP